VACSRVNHTARNRVLQKLTITPKVKKLTGFYGNRSFYTTFTTKPRAPNCSPLYATWIQLASSNPVSGSPINTRAYTRISQVEFSVLLWRLHFCARFASLPLYHTYVNLHLNTASNDQQNPTTFLFYVHARACRHYSNHLWDCIRSITVYYVVPIWGLIKHNFIACRLKLHRRCGGESQNNCYIVFKAARWWRSIM
jgi:hypothetical protein